jgi:hypothetical protein
MKFETSSRMRNYSKRITFSNYIPSPQKNPNQSSHNTYGQIIIIILAIKIKVGKGGEGVVWWMKERNRQKLFHKSQSLEMNGGSGSGLVSKRERKRKIKDKNNNINNASILYDHYNIRELFFILFYFKNKLINHILDKSLGSIL